MDVKFIIHSMRMYLFQSLLSKPEKRVKFSIKNNCLKKKSWRWRELFSWLKEPENLPSFINSNITRELLTPNEKNSF